MQLFLVFLNEMNTATIAMMHKILDFVCFNKMHV